MSSGSESTIGRLEPDTAIVAQKAMMNVFDGHCAIVEPTMRECGAWVREIAIAQLMDTRKNCHAGCRKHNVIDPQHEKLVEEIVEVDQIISQKHFLSTVQLFDCDILISSCCATKMTKEAH